MKCQEGHTEVKAEFPLSARCTFKAKILSTRLISAIHGVPWAGQQCEEHGYEATKSSAVFRCI